LIEDYAAGESITIMVDAKFFGKNIDVKHVESFIGMMQDVGVDKGLLITKLSGSGSEVSSQKQFRRRFLGFGSQTALLLVFFRSRLL
jgi:hypothetical protein